MKKHISAAFAVLALAACSKMAPENETVISELPEGENQQETVEPKGEGIVFQLPETKVILNGDTYKFEGTEEIVVKARSGAVTVMTNTTTDPNIFKGVFKTSLGRESETFDFYFNCANKTTAEKELVQNGQPWLECTGIKANRVADDSEANYVIGQTQKIELRELPNSITLALVSTYNCTVDFHSLSAKIPAATQDKTIAGMSVTAGKPYFVNINTDTDGEFKGGFYLAVNKTGETGTMYTSYATATPISKNTPIQIKTDFTPLSITGSLSGFNTSYSIYTDKNNSNRVADANNVSNDYMSGGSLTLNIAGISNSLLSLLSLVSLKSITIGSSDGVSIGYTDSEPTWENKTYTWTFNDATYNHPWGQLTVTATAVFDTPAGQISAEVPALTRHITGLPYTLTPDKDHWSAKQLSSYISFNNTYIEIKGNNLSTHPLIESSPHFHIPGSIDVNAKFDYSLTSGKRYISVLKMYIGGENTMSHTGAKNTTEEIHDKNVAGTLNASCPYIEFEGITDGASSMTGVHSRVYTVELKYK